MINGISSNSCGIKSQYSKNVEPKFVADKQQQKTNLSHPIPINFGQNRIPFLFIKPSQEAASNILSRSKSFGLQEYKKLSPKEKIILKKSISPEIQKDAKAILTLSKTLKENLEQKFPNGYTFVSIGRTPANFAKILEYQGLDSKICPISGIKEYGNMHKLVSGENLTQYGKFLKKLEISKETVAKSQKPFVFVDYTDTGASLHNFKEILAKDEIGIKGDNTAFLSLNDNLLNAKDKNKSKEINKLVEHYLDVPRIKEYSVSPKIFIDELTKTENALNQFEESSETKKLNFYLIDALHK